MKFLNVEGEVGESHWRQDLFTVVTTMYVMDVCSRRKQQMTSWVVPKQQASPLQPDTSD